MTDTSVTLPASVYHEALAALAVAILQATAATLQIVTAVKGGRG